MNGGAVAYLADSKYGANRKKVEYQDNREVTGGTTTVSEIYSNKVKQSTTYNAYGIYGLNGGAMECMASYVNNIKEDMLGKVGGTLKGDLYGADENERSTSTAYKTVYKFISENVGDNYYKEYAKIKGDAIYETSNSWSSANCTWYEGSSILARSTTKSVFLPWRETNK